MKTSATASIVFKTQKRLFKSLGPQASHYIYNRMCKYHTVCAWVINTNWFKYKEVDDDNNKKYVSIN